MKTSKLNKCLNVNSLIPTREHFHDQYTCTTQANKTGFITKKFKHVPIRRENPFISATPLVQIGKSIKSLSAAGMKS